MQSFIRTIINSIRSWTKKEIKNSTADWNQNDPNKPDYVKNRPFFEENGKVHKLDKKFIDIPNNVATIDDVERAKNVITDSMNNKMNTYNPVGTGSFSLNRKSGGAWGTNSVAVGYNTTASGDYSHAVGYNTTASGSFSHAEGHATYSTSSSSHAEGSSTQAIGSSSHAEGEATIASGTSSHAEGYNTRASGISSHHTSVTSNTTAGYCTHAEGYGTKAYGAVSHAEGNGTHAYGKYSHAEGYNTNANGISSHAEGYNTGAGGDYSHAEGYNTGTSGISSHAEGHMTYAYSRSQHVQGEYNIFDYSDEYAHIVGNGTSSARSNAHTLDWNGVGWYQGGLQVGGNAQDDGAKNVLLEGDAIPVPSSATTGQILAVKSVDETGKPTEWEAVDAPSGGESAYPGDDHINDLINTALGVIENGTY